MCLWFRECGLGCDNNVIWDVFVQILPSFESVSPVFHVLIVKSELYDGAEMLKENCVN